LLNFVDMRHDGDNLDYLISPIYCIQLHFVIMRLRISPIQSRTSRRDREFLILNIRLRDDTEKKISSNIGHRDEIEIYILILRLRDKNENSIDLISVFETRTGNLKVAILP